MALAVCVVFGGLAGFTYYRQHQLDSGGRHTTGKVVFIDESCDDDGCSYQPIVDYFVDDIRYEIRGMGISPTTDSIGESVDVVYDPDEPGDGEIDTRERWFVTGIFAAATVVALGVTHATREPS